MTSEEKCLSVIPFSEPEVLLSRRRTGNRKRRLVEVAAAASAEHQRKSGQALLQSSPVAARKQQSPTNCGTMSLPLPPSVRASCHTTLPASQRSTCLLCSDPVLISNEDATSKAAKERNEMVKILCFHMQVQTKEIPKNCTAEMFPFCTVCQRTVTQLWENEKIVQEAHKKISKSIAIIERTVADAEILRSTMKTSAVGEEKKFVKLRDRILDGYRTKLMMKQKMRESILLGNEINIKNPIWSHEIIMHDNAIQRQFATGRTTTATPSPSPSRRKAGDNATANVSPMNIGTNLGSSSASEDHPQDKQKDKVNTGNEGGTGSLPRRSVHFQLPQPQQKKQQSSTLNALKKSISTSSWVASTSAAQGLVGKYNENSCSMVISDMRTGNNDTAASPSLPTPPVVIKQEPVDSLPPAPAPAGKRKRRSLFQGIEILRVADLQTNTTYLQCSICRFKVAITGYSTGMSPYQSLTTHITEKHLGKKRRKALAAAVSSQALTNKTLHTCKICSKAFETKKSLAEHSCVHINSTKVVSPATTKPPTATVVSTPPIHPSYIQDLECNICGRPIKGNQSNLLAHKFSHKNNEERMKAMAAGEKGSRPALLRTEPNKRRRAAPTFSVKRVRKGQSKIINTSSKRKGNASQKGSPTSGPFKCQVCNRSFPRNCHLALHMQGHARRSMLPVPPSKRSLTPVPAKRRGRSLSNASDQQQEQLADDVDAEEYSDSQKQVDFQDQEGQEDSPPDLEKEDGDQLNNQMETDGVEDNANEHPSELTVGATSVPNA